MEMPNSSLAGYTFKVSLFSLFLLFAFGCGNKVPVNSTAFQDGPAETVIETKGSRTLNFNATLECVKIAGAENASACRGVTSTADTNAVLGCLRIKDSKDPAACAGVKTAEQVNAVLGCTRIATKEESVGCAGVKTVEEANAALGCMRILKKSSVACGR